MQDRGPAGGLSTGRIEAFSDGVFAIAITLLVLEVKLPQLAHDAGEGDLLRALGEQWLLYLSYLLSVVIIGVFWVAHHGLFSYIRRADRPLFWLNILFLATVTFIPFPTALLGEYGRLRTAVVIYGAGLVAAGLLLDAMRAYACGGRRLVDPDLDERLVRSARRRNLMGPAVYLAAITIAFIPTFAGPVGGKEVAIGLYILVPILYIMPGSIDRFWASGHGRGRLEAVPFESHGQPGGNTGGEGTTP